MNNTIFYILFYGGFVLAGIILILAIIITVSPKARAKWMGKQIEATKYMMDDQKENIKDISTNMADATKDGIKTTAKAIKDGLTEEDTVYCKHCGASIDTDSTFCKKCGKEQ